jgi:4-amino-4-deoxy-L-arabinose transferase-like glycosyltransferase
MTDAPALAVGVALFVALVPRGSFYGVSNDALAPLTGGLALCALLRLAREPTPSVKLSIVAGALVAAALLTKATAVAMLIVLVVALVARRPWASRPEAIGAVATLAGVAIPVLTWQSLYWIAGEPSGSTQKAMALGWTPKALDELWPHPIFGPAFATVFLRELLATFWRGELVWHLGPIGWPQLDLVYVGSPSRECGTSPSPCLLLRCPRRSTRRDAVARPWRGKPRVQSRPPVWARGTVDL